MWRLASNQFLQLPFLFYLIENLLHMASIFLIDFSIGKPDPGIIFWTLVFFLLVWTIVGRLAFRPIQEALKKREKDIQDSIDEAKKARDEMANLKAENEQLLNEAREERAKILKEAKDVKDSIIKEAKEKANEEARKIVMDAKREIENQRMAAVVDIKNQIGNIAIEVAEKVLKRELDDKSAQESFVQSLVDDAQLN